MWDAPEVIGYRKPFEVTPFKMIENVLQDDVIRHTHFVSYYKLSKTRTLP